MATRSVNVIVKARDDASKKFGKIGKAAGGLSSSLKGLAVAAAAAFSVRAIKSFISNTLDSIDALAKMSARINITADDLRGLRMAATQAGASNETLDKALQKMARGLGEAASGTGEAVRGLDMLGLSAKKLIDAGPAKAFKLIADKISEMGNQSEKAAAASFIFGRAGIQLVNVLDSGSAALDEMIKKSTELSGTLTGKQLKAVEDSNDAWDDLNRALIGAGDQIVTKMAPALELLADKLTATIKDTKSLTRQIRDIDEATGSWGLRVIRMTKMLLALKFVVKRTADDSFELAEAHREYTESLKKSGGVTNRAIAALNSYGDALKNARTGLNDVDKMLQNKMESLRQQIKFWGMSEEAILRAKAAEAGWTKDSIQGLNDLLKRRAVLVKSDKDRKDATERKRKDEDIEDRSLASRFIRRARRREQERLQGRAGGGMAGGVSPTIPGAQPQGLAARESRFLSGVTFGRGGTTPEQTTANNTKEMVSLLKDQKAILEDVKKNTVTIIPEGIAEFLTSSMA